MPVEIKELIIRTQIDYPDAKEQSPASVPTDYDPSLIVESCVKQVLKILKQEQKR